MWAISFHCVSLGVVFPKPATLSSCAGHLHTSKFSSTFLSGSGISSVKLPSLGDLENSQNHAGEGGYDQPWIQFLPCPSLYPQNSSFTSHSQLPNSFTKLCLLSAQSPSPPFCKKHQILLNSASVSCLEDRWQFRITHKHHVPVI